MVMKIMLSMVCLKLHILNEPRRQKTASSGFPTRSDTNRAVQPQKMARDLKFRIQKAGGLYYRSGENKGADQLRDYAQADLRLCFRICKNPVFSRRGSNYIVRIIAISSINPIVKNGITIAYHLESSLSFKEHQDVLLFVLCIYYFIFHENHVNKQNSLRSNAAFCNAASGNICLFSIKRTPVIIVL